MSMIDDNYERVCKTAGDIQFHLPKIKEIATGCNHITEFGVRSVISTWVLLSARPKVMVSYDIVDCNVEDVTIAAIHENIEYTFIKANTCEVNIENTELLFIDTDHTYKQLKTELTLHGHKVNKYIIMHDTFTYGLKDNPPWSSNSPRVSYKNMTPNAVGLQEAICEFLRENNEWGILYETQINNGLTILRKTL